jgi:glycosyltransferase involved in cell wall biosynthesis
MVLVTSLSLGGGAEQQVRLLAERLKRRGNDVRVVSMLTIWPAARPLVDELSGLGIPVDSLGMRRGMGDPRALLRLARLVRRWRPDVLHAHMVHANLLGRASRLFVRTPVVVSTMHNQNEGGQWRYVAYRLTHALSDLTTAVSAEAVDEIIRRGGAPRGGVMAVPNGVATESFAPDPEVRSRMRHALGVEEAFVWLAAGRLVHEKGFDLLLEAFAGLQRTDPTARLLIAGTGPLAEDLGQTVQDRELESRVTLLGFRPDLRDLMQAADGYVLASRWEGLPMVLLEAAASALPIVATDVAGARTAVVDGRSGIRVPVGQPDALGEAMASVMRLPAEARAAMGAAGRAHAVEHFDLERVVDQWEDLYRARLAVRSARS